MAEIRTLKLNLLADVDQFTKGLGKADNGVQGFGGKLADFGKKAAAAFAVAGAAAAAYAGKLLIDGVKAAIEDAAAQEKLAATLQNVTGATQAQIAATEDYITKTTLATGVADDELRPSLDRLVRATNDVAEAQKLQALALDVSAGTGKSLQAVTEALSKAQEGNLAGLTRLGVGLSKADLETMSLEEITAKLAKTFEGQASRQADTFQGKMARLTVAFNEGKETVGAFVLDAITPLVTKFVNDVIPTVQRFAEEMGPKLQPIIEGVSNIVRNFLIPAVKALVAYWTDFLIPIIKSVLGPVIDGLRSAFRSVSDALGGKEGVTTFMEKLLPVIKTVAEFIRDRVAPIIGTVLGGVLTTVGKILAAWIDYIQWLVDKLVAAVQAVKAFAKAVADSPLGRGVAAVANFVGDTFGGARAMGGPVSAGRTYLVGERGPELFTPRGSGRIIPNGASGTNITVNVTGTMMDPEGVAREVARVLEASAGRTGAYSNLGLNPVGLRPVAL